MDISWVIGRFILWSIRGFGKRFYYEERYDHLLAEANRFICKAQGDFAAYSFYCADSHRRMKACLRELEVNPTNGNALLQLRREVEGSEGYIGFGPYVNKGLIEATQETFKHMERFFSLRTRERRAFAPPRFCVKTFSPDTDGVFVFLRSTQNAPSKETLPWEYVCQEDVGLSRVAETGQPYLENDIPNAIRTGNYKNPRIDSQSVKLYRTPFFEKLKQNFEDVEWKRCWKRHSQGDNLPPTPNCYKSTLIIPISLSGNGMPEEFRMRFSRSGDKNYDNLLFGFLCADSHTANFFEEADKKIGYIFADMLSLFLILNMSLLEHSQAYQRAKICLAENRGFEPASNRLFFSASGG